MPGGWLIKLDLAGVSPADVRIDLESRRVVVRGARRDQCLAAGLDCYRMEIAYSRFERVVELPGIAEPDVLAVEFRDGMLLIRVKNEGSP